MKKITTDFETPKTQLEAVMWHLAKYGNITSWEAIRDYGITRLAEYIRQMREMGYTILREDVNFTNRFGNHSSYGKYIYNDPDQVDENGQIKMGL